MVTEKKELDIEITEAGNKRKKELMESKKQLNKEISTEIDNYKAKGGKEDENKDEKRKRLLDMKEKLTKDLTTNTILKNISLIIKTRERLF